MKRQHRHLHHGRGVDDEWLLDLGDLVTGNGVSSLPTNSQGKQGADPGQQQDANMATLVQNVYKTMPATFSGPITGYSTLSPEMDPSPSEPPREDWSFGPLSNPLPTSLVAPNQADKASSMPTTAAKSPSMSKSSWNLPLATSAVQPSLSQTTDLGDQQQLPTQTPPPKLSIFQDNGNGNGERGTSGAVKVGIAFGVLGGVLAVGLLVFFLFNRRRKHAGQLEQLEDDSEKLHQGPGGAPASPYAAVSTRSNPQAPRISLRPVTQFLPNWSGLDKRTSKTAAMSLAPAAAAMPRTPIVSPWDRAFTGLSMYSTDPFGNEAEREASLSEHKSNTSASDSGASVSSSTAADETPLSWASPGSALTAEGLAGDGSATAAGAAAVAAGAGAVSRKTSMRRGGPKKLDLTLPRVNGKTPPSPAGTEFSMTSMAPGVAAPPSNGAAAIAAAGGPPNSSVHRVQLDFTPTLDDELELKSGELIRLINEYDDGWALVIRLDRSAQGVVPRTCLSTRPVKPRPAQGSLRPGPPVKPSGNGDRPASGQRPTTPSLPPPGGRVGLPQTPSRSRMRSGLPESPSHWKMRSGLPASPSHSRVRSGLQSQPTMGGPMGPAGGPMGPAGGPMSAAERPMSPAGRPMSPAGRPRSPAGRPMSPAGRPMSPAGRPMSPGPQPQSRGRPSQGASSAPAPDAGGMGRHASPLGPSPLTPVTSLRPGPPPSAPPPGPVSRKPAPGPPT